MQKEILEANPDANLRVYAVWFNMLPRDSRGGFPADLLTDSRVTQFWDEGHLVGTAFAPLADWHQGVLWDAYFLYRCDARWETVAPKPLLPGNPHIALNPSAVAELPVPASWGRTIFSTRVKLKKDFSKME